MRIFSSRIIGFWSPNILQTHRIYAAFTFKVFGSVCWRLFYTLEWKFFQCIYNVLHRNILCIVLFCYITGMSLKVSFVLFREIMWWCYGAFTDHKISSMANQCHQIRHDRYVVTVCWFESRVRCRDWWVLIFSETGWK